MMNAKPTGKTKKKGRYKYKQVQCDCWMLKDFKVVNKYKPFWIRDNSAAKHCGHPDNRVILAIELAKSQRRQEKALEEWKVANGPNDNMEW